MNKETLTNLVMEQCKTYFYVREILLKEHVKHLLQRLDPISKEFKMLYKKTREYFDNFRHTYNKDMASLAKDLLVKNW